MISNLSRKEMEFRIIAFVTIVGTALLSLIFFKDYLTQTNGTSYSLPLSVAFFMQSCIAVLGLILDKRFLVFLTFSSYSFLVLIYVTFS